MYVVICYSCGKELMMSEDLTPPEKVKWMSCAFCGGRLEVKKGEGDE